MTFTSREFSEFNGLLATGVERGLSLEPALELLIDQARSQKVRATLRKVVDALREGRPLERALEAAAGLVPPEYPALVAAGAASRRLAAVLRQVEAYHALLARIRERFLRFGLYLFIGCALGLAVLGLLTAIGGDLLAMRYDFRTLFGGEKSFEERAARWIADHALPVFAGVVALVGLGLGLALGVLRWASRRGIGYWIPVWGPLFRSRDLASLCGVTAMRLRGGATLEEALAGAGAATSNKRARRELEDVRRRTIEGVPFSEALFYRRWFPRTLAWAVSIGETRGELPDVLDSFARMYAADLDRRFEVVYLLLTPLGILALGNLVFLVLAAVFVPILQGLGGY